MSRPRHLDVEADLQLGIDGARLRVSGAGSSLRVDLDRVSDLRVIWRHRRVLATGARSARRAGLSGWVRVRGLPLLRW